MPNANLWNKRSVDKQLNFAVLHQYNYIQIQGNLELFLYSMGSNPCNIHNSRFHALCTSMGEGLGEGS